MAVSQAIYDSLLAECPSSRAKAMRRPSTLATIDADEKYLTPKNCDFAVKERVPLHRAVLTDSDTVRRSEKGQGRGTRVHPA